MIEKERLIEKVAIAMWDTWNRVMVEYGLFKQTNGEFHDPEPTGDPIKAEAHRLLRNAAVEEAEAAIAACHAEKMRSLLQRLDDCSVGNRAFDEAAVYEVWRDARALLTKLDGKP